jgi:transcriptional regulator with XRE-family HTH domain
MRAMTRVDDPGHLGRLIRAVRTQSGLTQGDAAALCGVSAPFLNDLENGKPTARLIGILTVCRGLGIRLALDLPISLEQVRSAPLRKPRGRRR